MNDLDLAAAMIELELLKQQFQAAERENRQDPISAMAALVCAVEAGLPIPGWSAQFLALRFNEYLDIAEERTLDQVIGLNAGRKGQSSPKMADLRGQWQQAAMFEVWAVRQIFGLTVAEATDAVAERIYALAQKAKIKLPSYNSDTLKKAWNSSGNSLKRASLEDCDIDPTTRAQFETAYSDLLIRNPRKGRD